MYSILTYPLDIIKTNRILQTSLSKEGAESIPKEFIALYEKGGLQRGLFRGFFVGYFAANFTTFLSNPVLSFWGGTLVTVFNNPF